MIFLLVSNIIFDAYNYFCGGGVIMLLTYIRFCLSLSDYQQLPFHDQTILLLCSSAKLLLLNMAQLNFTFAITPVCYEHVKNNEEFHENSDSNDMTEKEKINRVIQSKSIEKCDEIYQLVDNKLNSSAFNMKEKNNGTLGNNTKKSFAQTHQNITSSSHKDSYPTQRFVDLVQTFISKCQSQLITDDEYHLLKCIVLFQMGQLSIKYFLLYSLKDKYRVYDIIEIRLVKLIIIVITFLASF